MSLRISVAVLAISSLAACGSDDEKESPSKRDGRAPPTGWAAAVGDDGTLVQTFNDVDWDVRDLAVADLFAITCVGNLRGWAAGAEGTVLATEDAGETWTRQDARTGSALRAIRFSHGADGQMLGIVAGDGGTLRWSRNGGDTWNVTDGIPSVRLTGIAISHGRRIVVVVGDSGTVVRSTDEGETYAASVIDGAADLTAIAMDGTGAVIATVDSVGVIWASFDGGKTFAVDHRASEALHSVAIAEDGTWGVAAGANGLLLERDRPGRWTPVSSPTKLQLRAAIVSHDSQRGYAAGADGTLLVKATSSSDWQPVAVSTTATLRALEDLAPE